MRHRFRKLRHAQAHWLPPALAETREPCATAQGPGRSGSEISEFFSLFSGSIVASLRRTISRIARLASRFRGMRRKSPPLFFSFLFARNRLICPDSGKGIAIFGRKLQAVGSRRQRDCRVRKLSESRGRATAQGVKVRANHRGLAIHGLRDKPAGVRVVRGVGPRNWNVAKSDT